MGDKSFGLSVALTNSYSTNLLNPPTATGGTNGGSSGQQIVVSQFRVVNKGATASTFRLYRGGSGSNSAGTELAYDVNVPVGGYVDLNYGRPGLKFDTSDFLVGGASVATTLVLNVVGIIRVAG